MRLTFAQKALAALGTGVATITLLSAGQASAAEQAPLPDAADAASADADDAIVVTARRREEKAQDVPVALSIVSAETLQKTGNFTIGQFQQLVPSLQVTATNPRNSNINIRGLGANSAIAVDGLEYGVGFYLDGVYYARPGQSQFDLVDLQQVEVLRGPQGTLFGKNTTAGAVNITTRAPSFEPELTAEVTGGNYGYHQVRASASGPLLADKVAIRLSVADTHRDGFLKNIYTGGRAQDYDNFSARGQLLIKPSDTLSIRLIGDYSRQKQQTVSLADGYFTTFANGGVVANNFLDRAARFNYPVLAPGAFGRRGAADAPYGADMKSYGVSGQVDWNLGRATLTSITAYRWWDWDPANDIDATSLSVNVKAQTANRQRQFSQELRLASDGHNRIDYVVGLYYFWQVIRGYGQTSYGKDFALWNTNPATPGYAGVLNTANLAANGFEVDSYSDPSTRSYAAFGQTDWHITDALTLTTGLRFTHEDKEGSFNQYWAPGTGTNVATLDAATAAAVTSYRNVNLAATPFGFTARLKDDALGGLVTLGYKVTPDLLVYGTYSHGKKSGGLNTTAGGNGHALVNPEKVDSYEIGFKSQWLDRKVTLNATGFLTEITDYQTSITQSLVSGATTQYIANIPKVRSKGVEADLTVSPSKWVSFTASGAITDAKYVSYPNALQATERLNVSQTQDLSGVALPGVAKYSYSLGVDLAQPLDTLTDALGGGSLEVYGHADFSHRSSFNSTANNSAYGIIPAYGLLNARIGLRTEGGKWDVSLWARNLTNENYYLTKSAGQGTSAASVNGLISANVGEPRTVGATLRTKF